MSRYNGLIADIIAIAVFALLARIAHQSEDMPLSLLGWLNTFWPFLLGVLAAWVLIALRRWDGTRIVPAGLSAWVITVLIGLGIWSVRNGAIPHWSFILVATISSSVLMFGWRGLAQLQRRRSVEHTPAA